MAETARSTLRRSCVRPSEPSTWAAIDCTPRLTRVTPPSAYARISSPVTSSGLHSIVTSADGVTGIAASSPVSSSAESIEGVPPPTNTLVASGIPLSTALRMSSRTEST